VATPTDTPTRLARVMKALGLQVARIAQLATEIGTRAGVSGISRQQVHRVMRGKASPTAEKIYIVVAAIREETGLPVTARDLFDVEPPLPEGARGALPSLLAWIGLHGGSTYVPVFSGGYTSPLWRVSVPDQSALPGPEAFEALYIEHGTLLRKIATRRYNVPPEDAEALVHDCFILYMQRHTSVHDPKPWLVATVCNACKHYWRDREHEAPLGPEHEDTPDPRADGDLDLWMRQNALGAVFARLGARCRETLGRYYLRQESNDTIAAQLSTKPGYVRQLLMACRRRARELYDKATGRRR
jgi:RNA polymerase sigma factor (sigma-70 family)